LPNQAVTQNDKTIQQLIYRGLFKYDNFGVLVPDLADSWSISDDGITYTIKLKPNQLWSDSSVISADDLLYTSYKVSDLVGVATDKVDALTVRYTLPNKFSPFLSLLSIGVMKAGTEERNNPLVPITNGRFRVLRIEKSGPIVKEVFLYNSNASESIKKIVFRYYENDTELKTASLLGEIDGFVSDKKFDLPNFREYKSPIQSVYYGLFFNLRNEKFEDVELRKKLQKVLPMKELISDIGIPVQGAISRSPFTDRQLTYDLYDKDFREDMSGLHIVITVPDVKVQKDLAGKIKNIWEDKLGLAVDLDVVDSDKLNSEVIKDRKFEVLLYGQEIGTDPDRYVNWHSTQKESPGLNLSGFEHVRADRALEEGRNEIDNSKRVVHYNEFQKVIAEQVPEIFLYHPFYTYHVSRYISGMGEKYTFVPADRFLDFGSWKMVATN